MCDSDTMFHCKPSNLPSCLLPAVCPPNAECFLIVVVVRLCSLKSFCLFYVAEVADYRE
jgi:hypothetical protein